MLTARGEKVAAAGEEGEGGEEGLLSRSVGNGWLWAERQYNMCLFASIIVLLNLGPFFDK